MDPWHLFLLVYFGIGLAFFGCVILFFTLLGMWIELPRADEMPGLIVKSPMNWFMGVVGWPLTGAYAVYIVWDWCRTPEPCPEWLPGRENG